jgi:phosphatidylglycerol:prolipoprotein diacylglycerol transferase
MASHGGFIGVLVACWWVTKKLNLSFLQLGDLLCPLVPPGILLGRIANFINGELWGKVTQVPWAVIFPQSALPGTPVEQIAPRHPSQLYEAGLEGALLLVYSQWRLWKTDVLASPGRLTGEFLAIYAVVRIFGEQFREPDAPLIMDLSRGSFYSIFLLIAGAFLIYRSRKPH